MTGLLYFWIKGVFPDLGQFSETEISDEKMM